MEAVNEPLNKQFNINWHQQDKGSCQFEICQEMESQSHSSSLIKRLAQVCEDDCVPSTSSDAQIPLCHGSVSSGDMVLYNEMPQCFGAVPSYCQVQHDGEVHVSVSPPAALRPCPSSTSVVSCARSETNSSSVGPTCRICDSASDGCNRLISPCRCSGTSKFVHEQCLNLHHWRVPEVSNCDLALHLIFLASISILIISATFTIVGFVSNHSKIAARRAGDILSPEELVVLIGGLTFFVAFIVALLTQIRASQTIYQLVAACVTVNTEWRIDSYHRSDDSLYRVDK